MLKLAVAAVLFLAAPPGFAKAAPKLPPSAQGQPCSAKEKKCPPGLSCVTSGDGRASCQISCAKKEPCPEDQRCVKDNGHQICRPINDADGRNGVDF